MVTFSINHTPKYELSGPPLPYSLQTPHGWSGISALLRPIGELPKGRGSLVCASRGPRFRLDRYYAGEGADAHDCQ